MNNIKPINNSLDDTNISKSIDTLNKIETERDIEEHT